MRREYQPRNAKIATIMMPMPTIPADINTRALQPTTNAGHTNQFTRGQSREQKRKKQNAHASDHKQLERTCDDITSVRRHGLHEAREGHHEKELKDVHFERAGFGWSRQNSENKQKEKNNLPLLSSSPASICLQH